MRLTRSGTGAIPESMIAMPMPLPIGSVSERPSCARSSLDFFASCWTLPFPSSSDSAMTPASGAELTAASTEMEPTPGRVSSHARSALDNFNEIALARRACRPTKMPLLRNVFNSETQSVVPSARTITLMVLVVPADSSICSICRSTRAFFFSGPPLTANITGACTVTSAATTAQVRTLGRFMTFHR